MTEIAVLTPDPADPSYAGQWPGVLDRLSEALATAGIKARPTPWTDHVESAHGLMDYPLVLPLIVWGYHRDHEHWLQACATWAEAGAPWPIPPRSCAGTRTSAISPDWRKRASPSRRPSGPTTPAPPWSRPPLLRPAPNS